MNAVAAGHKDPEQISNGVAGQFLTFMLAGEEYGIPILKVQEIKGWDRVTPIPNTPSYLLGVLNLRGAVVPIMDLRNCFGLPNIDYGPTTVVIVVRMQHEDQSRTVGLVVDAVADVYRLDSDDIQPPPAMGETRHAEFVGGLATVDAKMVILLEIDQLLDFDDMDVTNNDDASTS
ncbi:MAG: chemotaxis protein CheW [Pseudomonadota bacterium]